MTKHTPVLVDALTSIGCRVVSEPWGRHSDHETVADKLIGGMRDIPGIRRRLRSEPFDVMVVKTSHEARSLVRTIPLLAATRRLVPNVVVQFHGGRSDFLVTPGHRAFKSASAAVFALSDGVLLLSSEEARESHAFWPRGRFRVVSNPFLAAAEDLPARRRNGAGPLSLLFVGRLIREKGIFELVSAFAAISARHNCTLRVVGDGPETEAVARRVAELGIENKVALTGFLEGARLGEAYRTSDVFVFPTYREGFPTAVTEAMAEGLPVITTPIRGMADHLVEGSNALFVASGDDAALAAALQRLLDDAALRERMSIANRAKVADFAPDAVASQYLATLQDIIQHSAPNGAGAQPPTRDRTPATSTKTK